MELLQTLKRISEDMNSRSPVIGVEGTFWVRDVRVGQMDRGHYTFEMRFSDNITRTVLIEDYQSTGLIISSPDINEIGRRTNEIPALSTASQIYSEA